MDKTTESLLNQLVVKSNDIIEASYSLSLQEQRVIAYMIGQIKNDDKDFNFVRLSIKTFKDLIGSETSEAYYSEIIKVSDNLRRKTLEFKVGNDFLRVGWLASILYVGSQGYVQLEFSKMLKPYLLQLKKRFTKYYLNQIIHMRHSYSIRMFEILKQYEKIGSRYFDLDKLYWILKLEGKYKDYYDFKRRVLKPVRAEFNEKYHRGELDFTFDYLEHKTGRKVTGITFDILKPPCEKLLESEADTPKETIPDSELLNKLLEMKISKRQANNLIKKYAQDVLQRNIEFTKKKMADGVISNTPGFLIDAIRNDYAKDQYPEDLGTPELRTEAMACWNKNKGSCRAKWSTYKDNRSKACHYCLRFKNQRNK